MDDVQECMREMDHGGFRCCDGGENPEGLGEASKTKDMKGLLDAILEDFPVPSVHWYRNEEDGHDDSSSGDEGLAAKEADDFANEPFSMAANTVGYNFCITRTCTGVLVWDKSPPAMPSR